MPTINFLGPAHQEGRLLNNIASRQDGRGYALNMPSEDQPTANDNTARPKEDLEESPMTSSSSSSVDSQESGEEPNAVQNNKLAQRPLRGIIEPGINDCLTGRGGEFRALVDVLRTHYYFNLSIFNTSNFIPLYAI